ncbi:glycoside hydrolase family 71/99-like protein [Hyunsoonleella pacifica]|uniref:Uncharacterized protein n=1 Tax=Hyunsoonleella pacifica TaxID=1080224 RepID=A0A4Q9FQM8_9FLAO|nr:glycoside hydrolase family 71/99-like protein [Hyunsoonleella pacifica]TBN17761.1 hypothetical protein EYD46_05445 [Hyunsoonleella pacifica]GGD09167.1 hypothetical protein GCM10011368_08940 [Hyunsoonleella pacifica]
MKTFNKLLKIQLLLWSFIIISCSTDQESINQENTDFSFYSIPEPSIIYPDSVLREVLDRELKLMRKGLTQKADTLGMVIDKENPKKVYVHYMPWFQSKSYDGYWGQHWTMTNRNPDNYDAQGQQEVASYYNPLIGAYSSSDEYLQEYHFLLMKLCGIDGVIFDWYGSRDIHDYGLIKTATETFIPKLENIDLEFAVMYEDRVAYMENTSVAIDPVKRAKQDFKYINDVYFKSSNYLEFNGIKSISMFGPHHITEKQQWDDIYSVFPEDEQPYLLSLWGLKGSLGDNFKGEFLWVAQDHLLAKEYYYNTYADSNYMTIGSVYPGFASYYTDGGWSDGSNSWVLPKYDGLTFVESLNASTNNASDFIQIITWNDFGEGTMIEPTTQFGFTYLQMLQEYTGVSYSEQDLAVCARLYNARMQYRDNITVMNLLDASYTYMKVLNIEQVDMILQAIDRFYT